LPQSLPQKLPLPQKPAAAAKTAANLSHKTLLYSYHNSLSLPQKLPLPQKPAAAAKTPLTLAAETLPQNRRKTAAEHCRKNAADPCRRNTTAKQPQNCR